MISNKKKGQAALEFMTTYGWAMMVALAAIGTLTYAFAINPESQVPSTCTFLEGVYCQDSEFTATQTKAILQNVLGSNAEYELIACYNEGVENSGPKTIDGVEASKVIGPGETFEAICNFPANTFSTNSLTKVTMQLTYIEDGRSYPVFIEGGIVGKNIN